MSNLLKNSKIREFAEQLFKFCGVGVINTVVDFGIFQLIIMIASFCGMQGDYYPYFAQTVSYLTAVFVSYILNKKFTFGAKKQHSGASLIKMYVLSGLAFGLVQILLWFFSQHLGITPHILAKLFATVPVTVINFLGSKYWVFAEKK